MLFKKNTWNKSIRIRKMQIKMRGCTIILINNTFMSVHAPNEIEAPSRTLKVKNEHNMFHSETFLFICSMHMRTLKPSKRFSLTIPRWLFVGCTNMNFSSSQSMFFLKWTIQSWSHMCRLIFYTFFIAIN